MRQPVENFRGKTLVKLVSPFMGKEIQKQGKGKQCMRIMVAIAELRRWRSMAMTAIRLMCACCGMWG